MDPKEIRTKLGLAEDASDDQVHQALLAKAGITAESDPKPAPTPAPAPAAEVTPLVEPTAPATPPEPVAQVIPLHPASAPVVPDGMVIVDKGALESLTQVAAKAGTFITNAEKKERDTLVAAAIGDGRIPPASKDHWLGLLEKDPNAGEVLASLAPGVVPVSERGHSHAPGQAETVEADREVVDNWTSSLFPETIATRKLADVLASGDPSLRPRIMTDARR